MPKRTVLLSAVAVSAGLVAAVLPALAANQTVSANPDDTFSPATVTVTEGESVTWSNDGGSHNVVFDDGSFEEPASASTSAWTVSRTFGTPGSYRYFCEQHGSAGGNGMSGTVVVRAAPGTGTTPPPPGGGGGPGPKPRPPAGSAPAPVVTRFSMTRSRFRVGSAPKRGSSFEFRLSRAASVRITVSRVLTGRGGKRRYARRGALVRRDRSAGANAVPFSGRVGGSALAAGLHRATITATGANGRRSSARRTSFRIVAP